MTTARAVLIALLIVLAGCAGFDAPRAGGYGNSTGGNAASGAAGGPIAQSAADAAEWTWPADPPTDRVGWEAGYWHNESIEVDQSDGLNESEREAFVGRAMARVEEIRGLEFAESVPVEVVSRAEYRESSPFEESHGPAYAAWNNQVWESLLLVGEDRNASDVLEGLYRGSVLGYYSPGKDRIVIVSDSERPVISRTTLSHELMHALQDQQFGLPPAGDTQDAQLARNGVVEGDARYVERLYEERCGVEWECVPTPERTGGGGGGSMDMGVYLTIYTPYSEGPTLVSRVRERGGWAAVDQMYRDVPASTEQLIHPSAYPDEGPVAVEVPDRSGPSWSRFDVDPQADTVGEASLYAMFWANGGLEQSSLRRDANRYSPYNYSAPPTAGWAGDAVVPYRSDDGEYGYVLRTEWDTERDAEEFAEGYVGLLRDRHGATKFDENTYAVQTGTFADAFRVTREGTTVTVVNAPTAGQLDDVHRE